MSALRRAKLSTMATSCPQAERYSDVGHPQNPSPPRIRIRRRSLPMVDEMGRRRREHSRTT
jgi:hypothetical protein